MNALSGKLYPRSVKGKILAGFLLAFLAILLAFTITRLAFKDMLETVDDLSEQNPKLILLNKVFQEVTTLDQLQRAEAIRNPKVSHTAFLNQSQVTVNLIDSMLLLDWDSAQHERIGSMKEILRHRDSLFFSYLKLKSNLADNRTLTKKIDTLSSIIEQKKIDIDTSIVTTEKKTTTTYVKDSVKEVKEERSFLGKLFGKKKKPKEPEAPVQMEVKEETKITVDTLSVAKQNEALEEVEKIVRDLESDQKTQNKQLMSRELELINTNSLLVTQLLSILRQVEKEELTRMEQRGYEASVVVSESIKRISLLLLIFFLGAALLVYLIWTDIARSNYYKVQLEKSRDEAEQLSLIKERFLANMSHEIRTPLQSIIGFSEHLKTDEAYDKEAVDAIHSSSEHLLHIVNEVLDYSRISSGNFTFAREPFDLFSLVNQVASAMRVQAEKKHLTFFIELDRAFACTLKGDPFRLRQVLYNLLGNAIKFTTKGYVKLEVKTHLEQNHVHCEFLVSDTGIGIRKDDLSKIFNQFEQANAAIAGTFGGTGLGLTIVKSLIEAQGGSLGVESEPGVGSMFTVKLTFEKEFAPRVEPVKQRQVIDVPSFKGKVLVIDDDKMILRLCGLILQKNNIDYVLYDDAETLLREEPDKKVTHVFMDIRMPKISGSELCQLLKPVYAEGTRFIALTAHVFDQDKKNLYQKGFDIVLTKPFHEEQLLEVLTNSQKKTVAPTGAAGIDLEPLRKITMYDENLFQLVIQQFSEETTFELGKLSYAIAEEDLLTIREIIHKFAGRIGQIGMMPLSVKLREVELKIDQGAPIESVLPIIVLCRDEVKALVAMLGAKTEKIQ